MSRIFVIIIELVFAYAVWKVAAILFTSLMYLPMVWTDKKSKTAQHLKTREFWGVMHSTLTKVTVLGNIAAFFLFMSFPFIQSSLTSITRLFR